MDAFPAPPPSRLQLSIPALCAVLLVLASSVRAAELTIDGRLEEPAWTRAERIERFQFPWSSKPPPATEFRAFADADTFYFAFVATDATQVAALDFLTESTVDGEDRVEVFIARDADLHDYFCLEIDSRGRVHDYAAHTYRQFDSAWHCPGLRTAATTSTTGYTVEASVPLVELSRLLGQTTRAGSELRLGLFRADFRADATGDQPDNWLSWTRPEPTKPDFHVPSAFARWRIPGLPPESISTVPVRGIVLVPEDLTVTDWPERAKRAGLNTLALHDGQSPQKIVDFIGSAVGQTFLRQCQSLGLHVEYELHAGRELVPRERFTEEPTLFRMNAQGKRTPDANLCVHSARALDLAATQVRRLAAALRPTTGRYFFWGDDGLGWCHCPRCLEFSDADQALILENHLVRELRRQDPQAQLAHLAYANTLLPPTRVQPDPGIFLEYAPIHRRYEVPYAAQSGPEAKDPLTALSANLKVFPAATSQVLEYWLDVSRYSGWKRPSVKIPWTPGVLAADLAAYGERGVGHVTTFAVWIDGDYQRRFGFPAELADYGEALRHHRPANAVPGPSGQ